MEPATGVAGAINVDRTANSAHLINYDFSETQVEEWEERAAA
jgi:hypothetical protein